ncbi:MAG: hypothetical protein AAF900_01395 [Bacteroidota bacterium]
MGILEYFKTLQLGLIFFQTLVFLCTLFLLRKFAWNSILSFIKEQEEAHAAAMDRLEKTKQQTEKLEIASKSIIDQAKKRGEAIRENALAHQKALLEEGRQTLALEKEKMIAQAMAHLAEQQAKEKKNLKKKAATLIIHATEKLLRTRVENQYKDALLLEQLVQDATQEVSHKA